MTPKYVDCKWGYPNRNRGPTNLIRNQQVFDSKIINQEDFDAYSFEWIMQANDYELEDKHLQINLRKADYKELTGHEAEALFKIAAHNEINEIHDDSQKVRLSLKYQVLSDQTAVIGVLKQKSIASGELEEVEVKFNLQAKPLPVV